MQPEAPGVADVQHGVFTREQSYAEGWSSRQAKRRCAAGSWRPVAGTALTAQAGPPTPWQLAQAAVLTWPQAVVSHDLAGVLWGLPDLDGSTATVTVAPAYVLRGHRLKTRRAELPPGDVCTRQGIRMTTLPRTTFDLLALLSWPQCRSLWAWVVTRRIADREALIRAVGDRKHLGGTQQLRRLIDVTATGSLSAAEDLLHDLFRAARITGWVANAAVTLDGRVLGVVDVLFEQARLIIEVDGWSTHGDRDAFQRDRTRQNELVAAGYTVLRFTWDDLTNRPAYVASTVRAALARNFVNG